MPAAISIRGLRVVRGGRDVLHDLDLEVESGTVTGLLGPSGSGKTTLLRSVVGAQIVARGSVTVLGLPAGTPSLREQVGYQTQAPSVYADLTTRENLDYFASIFGLGRTRVQEVLSLVDLGGFERRLTQTLSGGELARLSLAAALLNRPDVVVLDEPTVGLDPVLRRDLWQMFRELAEGGATLLVSSHVMDEADRCDQLLLLRDGNLLASGTPDDLRGQTGVTDLDVVFLALIDEKSDES
jgi:ABC-2 type transport system ATP-binding protein